MLSGRHELEPDMQSLSLPEVGRKHGASGAAVYEAQTYADFASKAEKRNPDFVFTRRSMDKAFEYMVKRLPAGAKTAKPNMTV